jgi:hypothetical protein
MERPPSRRHSFRVEIERFETERPRSSDSDGALLRRLGSAGILACLSWHPCREFFSPSAFGKMPNASRLEACAPKD